VTVRTILALWQIIASVAFLAVVAAFMLGMIVLPLRAALRDGDLICGWQQLGGVLPFCDLR
jgi:hypothetical protein